MKKWSKRTIALAVACMLLLALLPTAALAASWESHWSAEFIQAAMDYGWVKADEDGEVRAADDLTRAEFAVILWRMQGSPDAQTECPFTDVTDPEVQTAVTVLKAAGIVNGTNESGTTFAPADPLTRQEAMSLLVRAFELPAGDQSTAAAFSDWNEVAEWAKNDVAALIETGWVNGGSDGRLAPLDHITLGEMCKIIVTAHGDISSAIEKVSTIAFMDVDGPKVQAVVVKYDTELAAGSVDLDTYEVYSYTNLPKIFDVAKDNGGPKEGDEANQPYETYPEFESKNGTPGAPTKVYVSAAPEIDPDGKGDEKGDYVIIELNTDYRLTELSSDWRACLAGGVQQVKAIESGDTTIPASSKVVGNYEAGYFWDINPMGSNHSVTLQKVFDDTAYVLQDLEGYQIYTSNTEKAHEEHHDAISDADRTLDYNVPDATVLSKVAGGAFQAKDCFSEYDGETHDVSLMYSIFVPEDYEAQVAAGKEFAMVLHIHDAGAGGTDPMIALTKAQAAANYASDEVQQYAKDQGLGGLIAVVLQVPKEDQTMADNLTGNQYIPATWQLLDNLTETYAIDTNRIYASGQSMGGMQVLDMAAQRDNYFAAIWSIGSQWGNNYNKEAPYGNGPNAHGYFTFPTDGTIITNPDWQNWYYSISDDNILVTNMTGDANATGYWNEANDLFNEFGGVTIPRVEWDPTVLTQAEQNAQLQELLAQENELGIYWNALSNGNHNATWIYAHVITDSYRWLLQQTKADEDARGKLEALKEGTAGYTSASMSSSSGGPGGGPGAGGPEGGPAEH